MPFSQPLPETTHACSLRGELGLRVQPEVISSGGAGLEGLLTVLLALGPSEEGAIAV